MLDIHRKIQEQDVNLDTEYARLTDIDRTLSYNISLKMRGLLENERNRLTIHISNVENKRIYNYYLLEAQKFLEEYVELMKRPVEYNFITGEKIGNYNEKDLIEQKYLDVVKKYYPSVYKVRETDETCCDYPEYEGGGGGKKVCLKCGLQKHTYTNDVSFKDADRINMIPKYIYDRRTHFKDCIKQFQGKQNSAISKKVYDDLYTMFEKNRLISKGRNKYKKITKKIVQMFLKETGHSKHYEDVTLIHSSITGESPPDISHLEELLFDDFDRLVKVYDSLIKERDINRRSFINTQYVLYQLLNRHGYPVKEEEFNILKTLDRKMFHDSICKELFEKLEWNLKKLY